MTAAESLVHVRVAAKRAEADGICSFELLAAEGGALPPFTAGAHIDVQLPGGISRSYSLCNRPDERQRYLIAVLRESAGRGGSAAMHDQVNEGDRIAISAPKNHFALHESAARSLLLAGGIGVTPILCMAERLHTLGADFELHYCTRSRERTAFIKRLAAAPFASRVHLHFDDGSEHQRLNAQALLATPQPGTHLYVCGPKGFMDHVLGTARAAQWPEDQLHCEYFSNTVEQRDSDSPFDVLLAKSGRTIRVDRGVTVVQALVGAGIEVPLSCEQGVCGTCLTRVLEGVPDHRDCFLTAQEQAANDQFTPCCSRAKTERLVLDL